MTYGVMLDTNIVSHLMRYPTGAARRRLVALPDGTACMSIITSSELHFGASKVGSSQLRRKIEVLSEYVPVLAFDHPADFIYADLRADLERRGQPIGAHDTLIAAHALALGLTLVTANIREFSRVPGLKVENWVD